MFAKLYHTIKRDVSAWHAKPDLNRIYCLTLSLSLYFNISKNHTNKLILRDERHETLLCFCAPKRYSARLNALFSEILHTMCILYSVRQSQHWSVLCVCVGAFACWNDFVCFEKSNKGRSDRLMRRSTAATCWSTTTTHKQQNTSRFIRCSLRYVWGTCVCVRVSVSSSEARSTDVCEELRAMFAQHRFV